MKAARMAGDLPRRLAGPHRPRPKERSLGPGSDALALTLVLALAAVALAAVALGGLVDNVTDGDGVAGVDQP